MFNGELILKKGGFVEYTNQIFMSELVFSYAENIHGKIVHVDEVPQGLKCGCFCPYCKEKLLARHGVIRTHGFAHHSDTRGANLNICYMVILYKLAEQIIQNKKRLHLPPYYGIYKEYDIEFVDVRVDSNFDRKDKQPDVIATTKDGQQFLIEFTFKYKVQRKKAVDYKNLTCLEIDLSNVTLEELEHFLLTSCKNRKWLNNQILFDSIEQTYLKANKQIKLVNWTDCANCCIKNNCCAVRYKNTATIIEIENSGQIFRICKTIEFNRAVEFQKFQLAEQERLRKEREEAFLKEQELRRQKIAEQERLRKEREEAFLKEQELRRQCMIKEKQQQKEILDSIDIEDRTCFMCKSNLDWMCRDQSVAHCGPCLSMGVPKNTPPDTAKHCRGFRPKTNL